MQPLYPCRQMTTVLFVFLALALPVAWPGLGAADTDQDEVRLLEEQLRNMEDFLRLRQQEDAGTDMETIRLERKVADAKQKRDAAYASLDRIEDIRRRAERDVTLSPQEANQIRTLVDQATDEWHQAYNALETAEANLVTHRHRIKYDRSRAFPVPTIEQHCQRLRHRLAAARQAAAATQPFLVPAAVPPSSRPTSSWSGETVVLSDADARRWLRHNGYLDANDAPTARFHDWQSRPHSSLDQSGHPLQGMAGYPSLGPGGRLEGSITIAVSPESLRNGGYPGGGGGGAIPGGGSSDLPVDESDRSALLADLKARHQRWYALYCRRTLSGCSVIPNGVRDELRNWITKATKQQQIDRYRRILDCYERCILKRPTSEQEIAQCRRQCKENIK